MCEGQMAAGGAGIKWRRWSKGRRSKEGRGGREERSVMKLEP